MNRCHAFPALLSASTLLAACAQAPRTEVVRYEAHIKPLIEVRCSGCHGPASPTMAEFKQDEKGYAAQGKGPRMDTYENLLVMVNGSDTGAIMRRLDDGANTKDGKPGNMYERLGDTPAERAANLALFKKWVGGWTLKKAATITPEERAAILAPR